jgi:hypothetical protein
MKKILFLFAFFSSLSSNAQYLKLCNDSIFYSNVELTKEYSPTESYTLFYMKSYVQKSDSERVHFFYKLLHTPPIIYTLCEKDIKVKQDNYIDDFLGWLILYDIKSKTNISFENLTDSRFPGFYCSDFPKFDSLIQKSKEEIIKKEYFNQKKEFIGRTSYKEYDYYSSYLFPYFENSIENRIIFTEKYYKKMDLKILQLIQADLDTSLGIMTAEFVRKKHIKKIVLNNVSMWRKKLEELKAEYSGN